MVECESRRMDGNSTLVFNALIRELLPPPRSWQLERGLIRAPHRIIGTMQAHLRSCIGLRTIHGFGGCLPYAQRRYRKRSARATSAATVGNGSDASATAVPVLYGILSIVTVVMEDEVRFLWWLLLFHLRLIEECAIEVLASATRRMHWCLLDCPKWRQALKMTTTRTNKKTACTLSCQVSRFMCTVLVLDVTSSLVSDVYRSVAPRIRNSKFSS